MNFLVFIISDDEIHSSQEKEFAEMGFRKRMAGEDKKLAIQLPYPAYAGMREGDSAEQVRDDILGELDKHNMSAFVLVAEGFVCGRT
ncbi:hypothetical protein [Zavarzinella formosa]|uniref:hypothetical protein n=1 Tax=Zavarzinella formosa TaxID=360055 RepID=UPI0004961E1A|nr:hypothetical protein [Zavarzinella formosa]